MKTPSRSAADDPRHGCRCELPGADVRYLAQAFDGRQADRLFAALQSEIAWERHRVRLFGREIEAPRLSSWIGDRAASYRYSGTRFVPHPWTPTLARLRDDLNERLDARFNSVLANLYRDGRDSMGWHSDDEPELGECPRIAALSFGAVRRLRFRGRDDAGHSLVLAPAHGSLLLMAGDTQRRYRHRVPATAAAVGPRISLTFRAIVPLRAERR